MPSAPVVSKLLSSLLHFSVSPDSLYLVVGKALPQLTGWGCCCGAVLKSEAFSGLSESWTGPAYTGQGL